MEFEWFIFFSQAVKSNRLNNFRTTLVFSFKIDAYAGFLFLKFRCNSPSWIINQLIDNLCLEDLQIKWTLKKKITLHFFLLKLVIYYFLMFECAFLWWAFLLLYFVTFNVYLTNCQVEFLEYQKENNKEVNSSRKKTGSVRHFVFFFK